MPATSLEGLRSVIVYNGAVTVYISPSVFTRFPGHVREQYIDFSALHPFGLILSNIDVRHDNHQLQARRTFGTGMTHISG